MEFQETGGFIAEERIFSSPETFPRPVLQPGLRRSPIHYTAYPSPYRAHSRRSHLDRVPGGVVCQPTRTHPELDGLADLPAYQRDHISLPVSRQIPYIILMASPSLTFRCPGICLMTPPPPTSFSACIRCAHRPGISRRCRSAHRIRSVPSIPGAPSRSLESWRARGPRPLHRP